MSISDIEDAMQKSMSVIFFESDSTYSEAPLSMALQNLSRLLSFHYSLPKGSTNFEW